MPYKNQIKYGLMLGANVVLFYYLYRWFQSSIHWDALKIAIFNTPNTAILSALVMGIVTLGFYAQRLAYLIDKAFGSSFWIVCYGFGANNILPFRIGDALKLYFARKYFGVSATKLLFIKVMEKFFDLSLLLVIGILAFLFGVIAIGKSPLIIIAALLIALLFIAITTIILMRSDTKWLSRLRQHGVINHFFNMFEEAIINPAIKKAIGVSVIIWMMTITMMYIYYSLALPTFHIGWNDALALVFLTTLSLGIPSAPGALGVFEAAIVFYLTSFIGVSAEQALATALLLHLLLATPQIILMLSAVVVTKKASIKSRLLSGS